MSLLNLSLSQIFVLAATWSTGTWAVFEHSARQPLVNQPLTWFLVMGPWFVIAVMLVERRQLALSKSKKK